MFQANDALFWHLYQPQPSFAEADISHGPFVTLCVEDNKLCSTKDVLYQMPLALGIVQAIYSL